MAGNQRREIQKIALVQREGVFYPGVSRAAGSIDGNVVNSVPAA
jgi:hypothetical protein